jgi:threonine aldolase
VSDDEIAALRASCPRALTHHPVVDVRAALTLLAEHTPRDLGFDRYGRAGWLADFEAKIAEELGKPAAVFLPSGTLAQQIAVRIWCDDARHRTVAFHPTCHLEIHESRAYAFLHDVRALLVGAPSRLMTVDNVAAISDPLGAFIVELPQREIGGQLPPWDELVDICDAARRTGAKLHLDGARLWEAAPFYGRSHAEIASLFDSVYVSFYKGLGALAGAALAGSPEFIARARVWQHRHGGRLVTIAPYALSARMAFEANLRKMPAYWEKAKHVARALDALDAVTIVPDPPHTNMFWIALHGDRDTLEARAHDFAREHGTFVFGRLAPTIAADRHTWEFVVGDATMAMETGDIVAAIRAVL